MPGPTLFEPLRIGLLELANRILVGPLCQYSAEDGCMSDWHLIHLGHLALSGAGLLTIETTAVVPEGRISHADLGLWNDRTQAALGLTLESIRRWSDMPVALELSHAGGKASVEVPWNGGAQLAWGDARGWQAKAPSALPCGPGRVIPQALDPLDLARIREGFASAAIRAARVGIDAVQLEAAHGYLLHQFLSPLCNGRADEYGGALAARMRFPLEVFDQVRAAFPANRPVLVSLCASDGVEGGWSLDQALCFARALALRGCAAFLVSSGGLRAGPGTEDPAPLTRAIGQATGIPVALASHLRDYRRVETMLAGGDADLVVLTRTLLDDPRWPWRAARALGGRVRLPRQYR